MKILIVGNGGREHALAHALHSHAEIIGTPENPGIEKIGRCFAVAVDDADGILKLVEAEKADLVVVGPELPLVLGLADQLRSVGVTVFGPGKAAARIEGSKIFAKELMKKYNIPTAHFETFADAAKAEQFIEETGAPIVIKADGLASGKGAIVCQTKEEAKAAVRSMLVYKKFGYAGNKIVIEEFLEGEETSILALTDGKCIRLLPASQDHKRAFDNDQGPNTGGMGAYAPAPCVSDSLMQEITKKILEPTLAAMESEASPYSGVLYAGLMLTPKGPRVIEFNCRFGDPETQAVLPLVSGNLSEILMACASGELSKKNLSLKKGACVCVVITSGGYPGEYKKGIEIKGMEKAETEDVMVIHAGTRRQGNKIVTNGGRVLGVTAAGKDLPGAIQAVYKACGEISFEGMQFRRDIGAKGLKYIAKH